MIICIIFLFVNQLCSLCDNYCRYFSFISPCKLNNCKSKDKYMPKLEMSMNIEIHVSFIAYKIFVCKCTISS